MVNPAKTCYVSMPFGQKSDPRTGRIIDFDAVYDLILKPAADAAGLTTLRGDEFQSTGLVMRSVLTAIISSDVMLADISTGNPNVFYEVGIRHALRRNVTVLVMARGTKIPFAFNMAHVLTYELDAACQPISEQPIRQMLANVIREGLARVTTDSPIYEFFSDLAVKLPYALASGPVRTDKSVDYREHSTATDSFLTSTKNRAEALRRAETELRERADADPYDYITLLRRYRDLSAWDEVIRVADSVPSHLADSPEVVQILSLALNRRRLPGDQDRALAIIEELIQETGGDGESYGILGRIYKDRYEECRERDDPSGAQVNLDAAIDAYRLGFECEPSNYYPGINAVTLLWLRGDVEARAKVKKLVPRVREAVYAKLDDGRDDYWALAAALELAVIAGDKFETENLAERLRRQAPAAWMVESTKRQLQMLSAAVENGPFLDRLPAIIAGLGAAGVSEGSR